MYCLVCWSNLGYRGCVFLPITGSRFRHLGHLQGRGRPLPGAAAAPPRWAGCAAPCPPRGFIALAAGPARGHFNHTSYYDGILKAKLLCYWSSRSNHTGSSAPSFFLRSYMTLCSTTQVLARGGGTPRGARGRALGVRTATMAL